ncbi:MAG TPA: hypothetical protein VFB06_11300 [Streptosporangiaceae bacterium]|nr:hypothetical protein [Streptosporangiaceae bacterium]
MTASASLEPGDYVVVRSNAFAGRIIRAFTRSWADHAFVYAGDGQILESTPRRGVRQSPLSSYAGLKAAANLGDVLTGTERAAVVLAARSYVGDDYGWREIVLITLRRLGFRWSWLVRPDKTELICSELVALAYGMAGLELLCGEPSAAYVTPADLADRDGMEPVQIGETA